MSEGQQPGQGSLPQEERETQDETTLQPTTYAQKRIDRLSWDTPLSSVDVSSAEEMPRLPSFKADDENVWRDRRSYLNRFDRRHLTPSTERPSTTRRSSLSHEISPDEIDSPTVTDSPSRPVSPLSLPADQPSRPRNPEPPSPVSPSRPVNPLEMESFDWSDESEEVSPTEYKRGSVAEMYHTTEEESPSREEKAAPSEDLTAPEVDDVSSGQDPFSNFDSVSPEAPQETIENVEGSPKLVAAPPMDYLATQREFLNDNLAVQGSNPVLPPVETPHELDTVRRLSFEHRWRIDNLQRNVIETNVQVGELRAANSSLRDQSRRMSALLEDATKRADTLEEERDERDVKTAMLEIELASEKEDHKKLKESGEKNQKSLNDLLEQNMKLKDALAEKDKRISIVEAQMKDERSKQQKADTSERDQAIITDLRKRLAEVRAKPDERIGRIEQLEHELFTARAEVNELQNWREYWMSDHPDEAAQFIELQAHMDAKSTEVNIGMSYVEKLSNKVADLEEQLQEQGIPVRQADSEFRRGISQWSARLRGLKYQSQGTQTEKFTSDSGTQTENFTSHHGIQTETSRKEAGTQSDNTTQTETSHGVAGIPSHNSPSPKLKPTYASSGTQLDNTSPQYTSQATQTDNGPASDNSNADNNAARITSLETALKLCKQHGATSAKTITDLTTKMASKDATIKQLEEHVAEVERKAAGEAEGKASEEGREAVGDAVGDEDSSEGEGPVDDLARLEAELEGDDSGGSSDGDEEENDNPAVPGCEGCNKLTGQLVGARKMAADLTAKLKGWEDRFVAAEEELMDAQDVVTELEDRVAELEELEAASTTKLDELSAANKRLTQELDDKITTSSELWAQREDLKRDLANRIKESEETIADLKNDLVKQRRLHTEEVDEFKEQTTRLEELSAANEKLTQELDDKITTSSELCAEREDLRRDLAKQIQELEETIADLKTDLIKQRRLRTEEVEALKEQTTRLKEQTANYQTTERETRAQLSQFRIRYRREGSPLPQQELTQALLLARQKHAERRAEIKRQRNERAGMRKKQREDMAMLISARQTYWLMTFRFKTLDANRVDVKTLWDHVPLEVRIKSDGNVEDGAEDAKDGDGVQKGGQY